MRYEDFMADREGSLEQLGAFLRLPLNAEPVEPGTRNAQVLIGHVAHSKVLAVQRLSEMFDVDEADAYAKALTEYGWHLSHFATCPFAAQARRS
jgi:hypothetical protein